MGAFVAPLITALSGLGGLFGNKKQTNTSTTDSTTTPNYDPQTQAFRDFLIKQFTGSVNNLPTQDQYTLAGTKNIQDAATNNENGIADFLASRGIGRTTAGANALGDVSYKQGKTLSDFQTNAPFNYANFKQPILSGAGGFLSSLPVGQTQHSTTNGTQINGPQTPAQGLFGGAAQGLAGWLGQYNAQQSLGNILKGIQIGTPSTSSGGTVRNDE